MNCYFSFWILNTYKATPFLPVFSFPRNEQNNSSSLCLLHISSHRLLRFTCSYRFLLLPKFFYTKMMWLRFFALMIKQKLCGNLRHFQTHIKWAHPLVKCSLSQFGISVQLVQDRSRRIHTLLPHRDLDTNMSSCLARLGKTTRTCVTGLTSSGLRHRSHQYIFTVFFFFWQGRGVHPALGSKLNREAFRMAKRNLNNFVTPKIVSSTLVSSLLPLSHIIHF